MLSVPLSVSHSYAPWPIGFHLLTHALCLSGHCHLLGLCMVHTGIGSTLYLDQWALIHKYTSFLSFVGISLRHVLHCIPEVPSKNEPKLFTMVICTTGYFPFPISLHISLLVPWEHVQNKLHALKCSPTLHNQVQFCQKTLGDSVEHPSELSHLGPRRLMYLPTDILLVIGKGCFQRH